MGLPEFHITSYYFKKPLGSVYFIYLKNQFLKKQLCIPMPSGALE